MDKFIDNYMPPPYHIQLSGLTKMRTGQDKEDMKITTTGMLGRRMVFFEKMLPQ